MREHVKTYDGNLKSCTLVYKSYYVMIRGVEIHYELH